MHTREPIYTCHITKNCYYWLVWISIVWSITIKTTGWQPTDESVEPTNVQVKQVNTNRSYAVATPLVGTSLLLPLLSYSGVGWWRLACWLVCSVDRYGSIHQYSLYHFSVSSTNFSKMFSHLYLRQRSLYLFVYK